LAKLRDSHDGGMLDEGLVLWLPGPHSETGEDMAELHLHGGRAVIASVLTALGRIDGLRLAEPGEFTRRAFDNGRIDLTAVEGLADLIFAETEAQRKQALRQLQGALRIEVEGWRERLIGAMAMVEATIDFSDEADVPEHLLAPAIGIARELRQAMVRALSDDGRGERLRDGLSVAIAGPPNAGKSSLLNRVARRDAAIVSPFAGTTRDVIEVHLDLGGYPVTLLDTAGIRESDDPVEQEGVRRARARAEAADLVLWVEDAGAQSGPTSERVASDAGRRGIWLIRNKIDRFDSGTKYSRELAFDDWAARSFSLSAATGEGVDVLISALSEWSRLSFGGAEPGLVTRARHRTTLTEAADALGRALDHGPAGAEDLIAEELRLAARALGRMTGRVDVEDVLDVIFRDFCVGK